MILALLLFATQPHVDMVVTVERQAQAADDAAAAVTVLRKEDLQKLPATNLAEALAFVPGLTMLVDPSAGAPVITSRGFFGGGEVEYVKVLIDGVPVADAESGLADWPRFRLADIEHIEVVHGPGSAMYGDTALGGVIQVFTRRGAAAASAADVHVTAGNGHAAEPAGHRHSAPCAYPRAASCRRSTATATTPRATTAARRSRSAASDGACPSAPCARTATSPAR